MGTLEEAALAAVQENLRHGLPLKASEKKARLLKYLRANADYRRSANFKTMGRTFGLDPKTCQSAWEAEFPKSERDSHYVTSDGTRKRVGNRARKKPVGKVANGNTDANGVVDGGAATSREIETSEQNETVSAPDGYLSEAAPPENNIDAPATSPPDGSSLGRKIEDLIRQTESILHEEVELVVSTVPIAQQITRLMDALQTLQIKLRPLMQECNRDLQVAA